MTIVHNKTLASLIKPTYTKVEVQAIWSTLKAHNSLSFPVIPGRGLFKAALSPVSDGTTESYTGYENVWVRDNVHVAHAHYKMGLVREAAHTLDDIMIFWVKYKSRWIDCILSRVDTEDVMLRPHIRFNGTLLEENEQRWSHAQNDAIGYFCWMYCKLARNGELKCEFDGEMIVLICLYHLQIEYWRDLDNGHWEEARKVEASSVGSAAAGYRELEALLLENHDIQESFSRSYNKVIRELDIFPKANSALEVVSLLAKEGMKALLDILPFESRTDGAVRETDGALLFLVYPLQIVSDELAVQILDGVTANLVGEFGIRRYLGDSYWMANYKSLFTEESRTADFSDDMSARDGLLKKGQEAQWCIFDSIASCSYGMLFKAGLVKGLDKDSLASLKNNQILFFNRAVGQVTGDDCRFGEWLCPESYYIENSADGEYVVNDVCPLLWTQANLINALQIMSETAEF